MTNVISASAMYLLFVASLLLPNAQGHESRGIPTEHKKIVTKPTVGSWSTGSDRFGWIGKSNMSHKIVYYFFPCSPHGVLWLGTTTKAQENSMCSHFGTVVYKQDTRNSQYILYVPYDAWWRSPSDMCVISTNLPNKAPYWPHRPVP